MRTVGIGVLVPHPDDDMRPRVTKKGHTGISVCVKQVAKGNGYALIVERLGEIVHWSRNEGDENYRMREESERRLALDNPFGTVSHGQL
jgi:hypothetical protein